MAASFLEPIAFAPLHRDRNLPAALPIPFVWRSKIFPLKNWNKTRPNWFRSQKCRARCTIGRQPSCRSRIFLYPGYPNIWIFQTGVRERTRLYTISLGLYRIYRDLSVQRMKNSDFKKFYKYLEARITNFWFSKSYKILTLQNWQIMNFWDSKKSTF